MKKILSLIMIGFLLLLSACSGSNQASGDDKSSKVLKIGAVFPMSGGLALLGEESYRGVELAIEQRNKNGGVAGGKKVELVKGDAPDADAAQAEANRLINKENIKTIVGSYSSGIAQAASEVTERNGVLFWEYGAVADSITDRGYKYVLRTNPPASYLSKKHIEFIKNYLAGKLGKSLGDLKVAIAHEDSSYGTTIADEAVKLAKKEGINIVTVQPYSATSNDLSSVVLNLKKAQPDVLIEVSYLNDGILLQRQSQELGLKVPVIVGSGGGHDMADYIEGVGDSGNGIFDVAFPQYQINHEFTPGMEDFVKLYKAKYGEEPRSGHSLVHFMGTNVLLDLINKVGEIDPDKLRAAAMKYKVEPGKTVTGWGVKFDSKTGQNTLSEPYVHQWVNGKLLAVWPEKVAVQEPQLNPNK
ncbi:ABC transporter substrate-binding protein [Bacillus sp. ISL-75]|uniref:ABC transporter substrate-binding protein n=1 Tax=Bacillus sp. ISL-75 TaxID=2819137 RepID=UPI001BE8ED9D|nr:ABC transporter substrate-binding protein [Bacillus sp. ISL-75]MBT2727458.1 ABC transporter substrate-binding protein [Bacillus sp. ISL-75]